MKLMLKSLALSLLVSSLYSGTALAEVEKTTSSIESDGVVVFEPPTGEGSITPPAKPEKPGEPIYPWDPTQPGGKPSPGGQGPLSIDFVSSFNFGAQEIVSADREYAAEAQLASDVPPKEGEKPKGKVPNFVQITDSRGTEAGWTLKVTQLDQFKTENKKVLTGGVVTLNNTNFYTHSESEAAIGNEKLVLTPGKASIVMTAKKDTGAGTQFAQWGTLNEDNASESVILSVPAATTKYAKQYSTIFNWELSETFENIEA